MKQLITFLALMCSYMLCSAQATTLTVDNKVAGTLSQRILYDDKLTVENLILTGEVNADDFEYLDELNSKYKLTGILDLSRVTIVSGGRYLAYGSKYIATVNNTFNVIMFGTSKRLRKLIVPQSITSWDDGDYYEGGGNFFPNLNVDSLVVNCPNLITVANGIGNPSYLQIGEGIETLHFASKTLGRLPGASDDSYLKASDSICIVLPSTLKALYGNKRMGNPYVKIYSHIQNPESLSDGGTKWYDDVLTNGIVYAPSDTKERYEVSIFKHLEIIAPISVKGISLNTSALTLRTGEIFPLVATISPSNADNKELLWSSSDSSVLEVSSDGTLKALRRGEALVTVCTADNPTIKAECSVIVVQPVESINLTTQQLTLKIGESTELVANVLPSNANNPNIKWESTNEYVVKVSNNGSIAAISKGTATISAISEDNPTISSKCIVNVIQPVESLNISTKTITLKVGESATISASVSPTNADNTAINWTSMDNSIASVDNNGKVTAIKAGETKIIVSSIENSNIKEECTITVIQPTTGIYLNKTDIELIEDESEQLLATVMPEDASNKSVNWTSSDISVAMVSPDGTVYAVKNGQATIMATTVDGGFVALCKVTVRAKTMLAENLTLSQTSASLAISESIQLDATLSPDNVTNKSLRWSSTNVSVATVSENGLVTGISEGTTQIIVTTTDGSNLSAICNVVVEKQFVAINTLSLNPNILRIEVADSKMIVPVIAPTDATNKNLAWSSTNSAVATITQEGVVYGVSEGKAIIIATTQDGSNLSAICEVEVYRNQILVTAIILNPNKIDGGEGETCQVLAKVLPEYANNKDLLWSSSDITVASVSFDGLVTLKAKGTATITATATDGSDVKAECLVNVSEKDGIEDILINKDTYVKIFTLTGIQIFEGEYSQSNLTSGTYIVLYNSIATKQVIK